MRAHAAWGGLLALTLLVAGCHGPAEGEGSASLYLKDAPEDAFDEVHLVLTRGEVHAADADQDDRSASWITLFDNATGLDIELLATAGDGIAALLGEGGLESGRYTQIRLHAVAAYGLQDGNRTEIELPNPVLRVVRSFNVTADEETRIVIDLDLDRSLRETGPRGWRLTPVIGTVLVETVADHDSGADVHTPGEPVRL